MLPTSPWKILNIFPYGSNEETILPQSFTFTVTECNKKPSNTKSTRWSRLRGCGAYQRCRSECKHWSIKPRLKDLKGQRGKPLETCHNWQSCWFLRRSCCSAFISPRGVTFLSHGKGSIQPDTCTERERDSRPKKKNIYTMVFQDYWIYLLRPKHVYCFDKGYLLERGKQKVGDQERETKPLCAEAGCV